MTEWRGAFENAEVNALHAECFEHRVFADDWLSQVNRFSLEVRAEAVVAVQAAAEAEMAAIRCADTRPPDCRCP